MASVRKHVAARRPASRRLFHVARKETAAKWANQRAALSLSRGRVRNVGGSISWAAVQSDPQRELCINAAAFASNGRQRALKRGTPRAARCATAPSNPLMSRRSSASVLRSMIGSQCRLVTKAGCTLTSHRDCAPWHARIGHAPPNSRAAIRPLTSRRHQRQSHAWRCSRRCVATGPKQSPLFATREGWVTLQSPHCVTNRLHTLKLMTPACSSSVQLQLSLY